MFTETQQVLLVATLIMTDVSTATVFYAMLCARATKQLLKGNLHMEVAFLFQAHRLYIKDVVHQFLNTVLY